VSISRFASKVYELTSKVPRGKVTTYGAIARRMGRPRASRAVGAALRTNPTPIVVPCHRVVKGDGSMGGYGGTGGIPTKARLLRKEGVKVRKGRVNLSEFLFTAF
jgi:methylated-DNA-[protein]-cysteine S-methyltransferase